MTKKEAKKQLQIINKEIKKSIKTEQTRKALKLEKLRRFEDLSEKMLKLKKLINEMNDILKKSKDYEFSEETQPWLRSLACDLEEFLKLINKCY